MLHRFRRVRNNDRYNNARYTYPLSEKLYFVVRHSEFDTQLDECSRANFNGAP
jgi:hypothetical protein